MSQALFVAYKVSLFFTRTRVKYHEFSKFLSENGFLNIWLGIVFTGTPSRSPTSDDDGILSTGRRN